MTNHSKSCSCLLPPIQDEVPPRTSRHLSWLAVIKQLCSWGFTFCRVGISLRVLPGSGTPSSTVAVALPKGFSYLHLSCCKARRWGRNPKPWIAPLRFGYHQTNKQNPLKHGLWELRIGGEIGKLLTGRKKERNKHGKKEKEGETEVTWLLVTLVCETSWNIVCLWASA